MKIVSDESGLYLFDGQGNQLQFENLMSINIEIGPVGTVAYLAFPVHEVEVEVPDNGVMKIKKDK